MASKLDNVISLTKRRGFVYPCGEIYGGTRAAWDYGPYGVELKENIKRQWWKAVVQNRADVVGLDSSIILPKQVWVASGHVGVFSDPLTECKSCHKRFRADQLEEASPRPLLREHVYLTIRNAIVRGELAPGERVRDTELGDWLGVSRTPVREALLRLERAQLVQTQPGRTTIIAPEDPEAVQHARQIVAELQALAARLATPSLDEQQLGILRATNEALGKALLTGDIEAAITADDAFHDLMVQACGNPLVGQHLEPLMATLRRTEYLHFAASSRPNSVQAHDAIIRACEQGDAELAARLVHENWSALNDPIGATQPLREERTEP